MKIHIFMSRVFVGCFCSLDVLLALSHSLNRELGHIINGVSSIQCSNLAFL